LTGGNRKFATYELFKYTKKDFQEKMRVLKEGAFCVEFLPEENEVNYQYLYEIKQMAIKEGFKYFTKVPWIKGDFKANTGRKSKNREDIMFFSKGEPRTLKLDAKKNIQLAKENDIDVKGLTSYEVKERLEAHGLSVFYMKGTSGMLPTEFQSEVENFPKEFDFQPRSRTQKVMEAEKPVALMVSIIEYISLPDELLLDQFGGSGNFGIACLNTNRNAIIVEKDEQTFERMKDNIVNTMKDKSEANIYVEEVDLDEDMDVEMELM
jgi:DNA modification methylase